MELWTKEHALSLPFAVAAFAVIAFLLYRLLGNKEQHIRIIPLQVIAVLLLLLELGKQVLSFVKGYDLYHLPFHFCSLFIFLLPLAAFYRGKGQNTVKGITAACCGAVTFLMLLYPNLIYPAHDLQRFFENYFSFHTVVFHNLVILAFFCIIALRIHTPEKGEQKAILLFVVGFCIVAATMSQLLKTNYANMYTCNVPVLETVRLSIQGVLGYWPAQIVYVAVNTCLHLPFVWGSYHLYRFIRKGLFHET
jgi:uncharacterized membrane protein